MSEGPLRTQDAVELFSGPRVCLVGLFIGSLSATVSVTRADDVATTAQDKGGKSTFSIPVYEIHNEFGEIELSLGQCLTGIANRWREIKSRYAVGTTEGAVYVHESRLDALDDEITALQEDYDKISQKLRDPGNWARAFDEFQVRLQDVYNEASPFEQEKIDEQKPLDKFPAPDKIAEKLVIRVSQWEKLQRLDEVMEGRPAEVVQQQNADLLRALPVMLGEAYGNAERCLRVLDNASLCGRKISQKAGDTITKDIKRIWTLAELHKASFGGSGGLEELAAAVGAVWHLWESENPGDNDIIVAEARSTVSKLLPELASHEALGKLTTWCDPEADSVAALADLLDLAAAETEGSEAHKKIMEKHGRIKRQLQKRLAALGQYERSLGSAFKIDIPAEAVAPVERETVSGGHDGAPF